MNKLSLNSFIVDKFLCISLGGKRKILQFPFPDPTDDNYINLMATVRRIK